MVEKASSSSTILLASLATSVPAMPIARPTSAFFSDGASLVPSPVMATTSLRSCSSSTILYLSSGRAPRGKAEGQRPHRPLSRTTNPVLARLPGLGSPGPCRAVVGQVARAVVQHPLGRALDQGHQLAAVLDDRRHPLALGGEVDLV